MDVWYEKSFGEDYLRVYKHRSIEDAEIEIRQIIDWLQINKDDLILDLCCGAGRHTIAFAQRGLHVVGLDLSKALLTSAQNNAGTWPIPFISGDMRELPFLNNSFTIVVNLFTSFGYFSSDDENKKVLQEIGRIVKPGGRFLVDYMNPLRMQEKLVPISEREEQGIKIREKRFIEQNYVCKEITMEDEEGRRSYNERVRMYKEDEMREMMKEAGLSIKHIYGSFQGEQFHSGSDRMIFVGKVEK